jgi:hypothetical protein
MCPRDPGTAVSINVFKPKNRDYKKFRIRFANFTWVTRHQERCQRRRFGLAAVTIADLPLRGAARGSLARSGRC